jgi:hypothetical protein
MPLATMRYTHREGHVVTVTWPTDTDRRPAVVLESAGYDRAARLTDALNARFGQAGPLAALGRAITDDVGDLADEIARRLR